MTKKNDLLPRLREIYTEYTGLEVAEAIRTIRQELEAQREELLLDEEIARLLLKREYIGKVPLRLQRPQSQTAEQDPQ